MAAIDITISGVLYDKVNRTTNPVTIIGEASLTGLAPTHPIVIPPPQQPPSGGQPIFPIWGPPGIELPPGAGYPPVASHPLPPMPSEPPQPPDQGKPPPPEGGWGYHPDYGWGYFPGGGGKPQPPR